MNWIEQHPYIFGASAALILAAGAFWWFSGESGGSSSQALTQQLVSGSSEGNDAATSSGQLVQRLLEVREISFDDSVFDNSAFDTLQSTAQPLPSRSVGRDSPFAPVSNTSQGQDTEAAVQADE